MNIYIPHGNIHTQCLIPFARSLAKKYNCDIVTDITEPCMVVGRHLLQDRPPEGSIIINTEYWYSPCPEGFEQRDFVEENNGEFGEFEPLVAYDIDEPEVPPIESDILFAGCEHPRRLAILHQLHNMGYKVAWINNKYESEALPYIQGAKVILDIHYYYPKAKFNILRLLPNMLRGKAIVSESMGGYYGGKLQGGYVAAHYDDIVDECVKLLKNDDLRKSYEKKAKIIANNL